MKRVCIIGHFGFGKELKNGQTIKTKIFADEIEIIIGQEQLLRIDSCGRILAKIHLFFSVLHAVASCKNIVIFPAHNGVKVLVPLLCVLNVFFKRSLHYVVVGGWLPELIRERPCLCKALKRFNGIYVETNTLKQKLMAQGLDSVFVLPNCKKLNMLTEKELVFNHNSCFVFCTFSRVMREKGIGDAVKAIVNTNNQLGQKKIRLDIYGPIDHLQTSWFTKLITDSPEYISYCGVVDYFDTVSVLKKYDALLFPTKFFTEGIPGTVIDAFSAGVPVIYSKWESCFDIIDDNITGIGYEFGSSEELTKTLIDICMNPDKLLSMKKSCLAKASMFDSKTVVKQFIGYLK